MRMHVLLLLSHVPMAVLAIGMLVALALLDAEIEDNTVQLLRDVADDPQQAAVIHAVEARARHAWLVSVGGFLTVLAVSGALIVYKMRRLSERIQGVVRYAEHIGKGEELPRMRARAADVIGVLEDRLGDVAEAVATRDQALRADTRREQLEGQLSRALAMAETEADVLAVAERAFGAAVPDVPVELLLADSSRAHLRRAASHDAEGVGCGVASPRECHAVRTGQTLIFDDSAALDACPHLDGRNGGPHTAVCAPVTSMGRSVGVVSAFAPVGTEEVTAYAGALDKLSSQLSDRLGMIRALAATRQQADTDPLTGLLNRRSLDVRAGAALRAHDRVAVTMCDLDHFKRLNDTAGHDAGDRALRAFSQVVRNTFRPDDILARLGGEEFVIVLPGCDGAQARAALERLRAALATRCGVGDVPSFTVSAGVAVSPEHGDDLDALVRAADDAVYAAKEAGRDRVVVAGEDTSPAPEPRASDARPTVTGGGGAPEITPPATPRPGPPVSARGGSPG